MASIVNQNAYASALPNFRNLGVVLRILVIVNLVAGAAAVLKSAGLADTWRALLEVSVVVQPVLILSLLVLMVASGALRRSPYYLGAAAVIAIELVVVTLVQVVGRPTIDTAAAPIERYWVLTFAMTLALLAYFDLRGRALSPALSEARLQALQARIRPHFLFNSINAVLSLVRQEPRRAEAALEDLAGLFRALMADNRELTPVSDEIELCRQYLDLEQLRLGDRLRVEWHVENMPPDALVPPLALQPLLENAVYHGIEPAETPGVVSINIYAARDRLHVVLRNPYRPDGDHHAGNKMALANIRERLQLHFDVAAELTTRVGEDAYEVRIVMPYVRASP
jgi:two-component system sensor histidine kinase AlgZ